MAKCKAEELNAKCEKLLEKKRQEAEKAMKEAEAIRIQDAEAEKAAAKAEAEAASSNNAEAFQAAKEAGVKAKNLKEMHARYLLSKKNPVLITEAEYIKERDSVLDDIAARDGARRKRALTILSELEGLAEENQSEIDFVNHVLKVWALEVYGDTGRTMNANGVWHNVVPTYNDSRLSDFINALHKHKEYIKLTEGKEK